LGCRYGVRSVVSIDVLNALHVSRFVVFRVSFILYMPVLIFLGYVQVIFNCCRFCILEIVGARLLSVHVVTVQLPFPCRCANIVSGALRYILRFFYILAFSHCGYVFGG
jgi:hypothetical protein